MNGGGANQCCYDIRRLRIGSWRFFRVTPYAEAFNIEDIAFA